MLLLRKTLSVLSRLCLPWCYQPTGALSAVRVAGGNDCGRRDQTCLLLRPPVTPLTSHSPQTPGAASPAEVGGATSRYRCATYARFSYTSDQCVEAALAPNYGQSPKFSRAETRDHQRQAVDRSSSQPAPATDVGVCVARRPCRKRRTPVLGSRLAFRVSSLALHVHIP